MFTVTIIVVAAPAGPVGRVDFQESIGEPNAAEDERIVPPAQPESNQLQKIDAELRSRRQSRIECLILDRQHALIAPRSLMACEGATRT